VTAKRPRTVIQQILEHGFVTTEELKKLGGEFMLKCFGGLQVTETQEETQYSQNCTVQKSVIYVLPFLVSTQAVFMSL